MGTHVARVGGALDAGLERRLDLLLHELLEVDVLGKEGVCPDRLGARDAQALLRVAREQAREERARVGRDFVAEAQRVGEDLQDVVRSAMELDDGGGTTQDGDDAPSGTSRSCSPSRRAAGPRASRTGGRRGSTSRPVGELVSLR